MPIEPPDPLVPQDLIDFCSSPAVRWADGHLVDTSDNDTPYFLAVLDGAWVRKEAESADTYKISEDSFETLDGARDPQPDGQYTGPDSIPYSLHPTNRRGALWAVADVVPRSA